MIVECKKCNKIKVVQGVKYCTVHGGKSNDKDRVICAYYSDKHKS